MKKRRTKLSLIGCVMAFMLTLTMLIGTTYAWFTDSVSSTNTRIESGLLQVDLLRYDEEAAVDGADGYVSISDTVGDLFAKNGQGVNWEPGRTEIVYLAVENTGNVKMRFKVEVKASGDLMSVLHYAVVDRAEAANGIGYENWADLKTGLGLDATMLFDSQYATVDFGTENERTEIALAAGERYYFALAVHMSEGAGNEYISTEDDEKQAVVDVTVHAVQGNGLFE